MASTKNKAGDIRFSNDVEVTAIRVDAKFSGITKDSLDVYPKTLTLQRLNIPLHRFGTWVFELLGDQNEGKKIARTIGPVASFIWALQQSYPEIPAWVDNASDCSFVLEFEKGKKNHYLNEIVSQNMRGNLQEQLKKLGDLKLKLIKIASHHSSTSKVMSPATKESDNRAVGAVKSGKAKETADTEDAQVSTDAVWKRLNLAACIKKAQDTTEKLRLQTELALVLHGMGKTDDATSLMDEVQILIPKIQPSQEKNAEILENLRKLTELYEKDGKLIESIEILLRCAELVRKVKKPEDRLELINTNIAKICEIVAKMYKVKPACIQASVNADSELGRPRPNHGSGTLYSQAQKLQGNGKRAFKKFKMDEALGHFEAAVKLLPNEPAYHLDKAEVYLAKGEMENCTDECNKAEKLASGKREKAKALELLGEVSYRSYKVFEAFDLFEKARLTEETPDILTKLSHLDTAFQTHLSACAWQTLGRFLRPDQPAGANPLPPDE